MEIEGSGANGQAKVWLSGNQQPLRISLDPALLSQPVAVVEEAVFEALRNAYETSTTTMRERMDDLTGGLDLNLPGLGG